MIFGNASSKNESSIENYIGEETSFSGFGLGADYIKHLNNSKITPYVGAGVGFFTGKIKTEEAHMQGSGYSTLEESGSEFYVRALFGVEYFIRKNVSLSGEYQLPYTRTTEKATSESHASNGTSTAAVGGTASSTSEATTKSSSLGISATGYLTLTIYFNDALF